MKGGSYEGAALGEWMNQVADKKGTKVIKSLKKRKRDDSSRRNGIDREKKRLKTKPQSGERVDNTNCTSKQKGKEWD